LTLKMPKVREPGREIPIKVECACCGFALRWAVVPGGKIRKTAAARTLAVLALFFLLFSLGVSRAYPWGDKAHRVVALIAEASLMARSRAQIEEIFSAKSPLADAAVWPDYTGKQIGDFDALHYVNIPDHARGYDRNRDCRDRNCVVEALSWFKKVASDTTAPKNVRRIALRFVAHLVGDIHQPLHAGRAADRGGNDIRIYFKGEAFRLHEFWDVNLVELEPGTAEEMADRLIRGMNREERRLWEAGGPERWAEESFALARSHAYKVDPSGEISDTYIAKALPVVRKRLAQAGIRLGWMMNQSLR
jgi:hypothetical protein